MELQLYQCVAEVKKQNFEHLFMTCDWFIHQCVLSFTAVSCYAQQDKRLGKEIKGGCVFACVSVHKKWPLDYDQPVNN